MPLEKNIFRQSMNGVLIGLGANVPGAWGAPRQAICRAIEELSARGLSVVARSPIVETEPVGSIRQPRFTNAVVLAEGAIAPGELMRLAKRLERAAGRRQGRRWGPRPLDVDILAFGGRRLMPGARRSIAGRLVLPHPELHRRGFVLVPLAAMLPRWRHPVLGVSAADLLRRAPRLHRGITPAT